jgi:hypothetical protein
MLLSGRDAGHDGQWHTRGCRRCGPGRGVVGQPQKVCGQGRADEGTKLG